MSPLRTVGCMLTAIMVAAGCGTTSTTKADAAADGSSDRALPGDSGAADLGGEEVVLGLDGERSTTDTEGVDGAGVDGNSSGDSGSGAAQAPLIECFVPQATGCAHGVLESTIAQYWDSPYGQGPRFLPPQGNVTVRPDGSMSLGAGTLYFWARHFDPFVAGQTHVLAQVAMVDGSGQVDTSNRAHVLFRDGNLEGLVAQDTLQVGPLAQSADWERDAIAPGQWHQYALSWDDRELCLFVDGGLLARQARSSPLGMAAAFPRVYVGARFDGTYPADSQIAHLVLWNERLTHPDIQRLYLAELEAVKLPVVVQAAAADGVPHDRIELTWGGVLPVLDFHVTPAMAIGPNGRVLVAFPHSSGEFLGAPPWPNVTVDLPDGVTGSADCIYVPRLPLARVCMIAITAGTVAPSTDMVLHLANVPLAAKATISRKGASNVWPQVFVDCGGDTSCSGALLPVAAQPSLAFVPPPTDPRVEVFARMPSTVTVGEPFSLHLWAEKADSAPDLFAAFSVSFTAVPELGGLPAKYAFVAGDDGSAEITGLTFTAVPTSNGSVLAGTTDADEVINVNPVEVMAPSSSPRLYWGDLHLHSTFSDGKEPATWFYPFGRSRGLDFAAISDHINSGDVYGPPWEFNHTMDTADWQQLQALARTYDAPGAFVTLLGFEFSAGSIKEMGDCLGGGATRCPTVEGDWNTYFSTDSAPLFDSNSVFAPDGLLATVGMVDPLAVVIPHFGGRRADLLGLTPEENQARVPVVEIISNHTAPPSGAEGWATQTIGSAVRLGFVGSSDDHSGHPGRSMWGTRYGYLAAWAESLDRAAILDAIRRRHTYACSHFDRPIVRVSANHGAMMGDSVALAAGEDPAMTLTVESRVQVTAVSLVRDGTTAWQSAPTSGTPSAPFAISVPYTEPLPQSPTSYYWKITFDNTAVVWTSPIWFDR